MIGHCYFETKLLARPHMVPVVKREGQEVKVLQQLNYFKSLHLLLYFRLFGDIPNSFCELFLLVCFYLTIHLTFNLLIKTGPELSHLNKTQLKHTTANFNQIIPPLELNFVK